MNPYDPSNTELPPLQRVRGSVRLSRKRIIWNSVLAIIALLVYGEIYTTFVPKLTRVLTSRFDDVYAISAVANLADLLTPAIVLLSLSTLYFDRRGVAMRLPFVLPVFSILMDHVPPDDRHIMVFAVYLFIVSSILIAGLGWPVILRRISHRLCVFRSGAGSRE